jgi:ribosome-associated protein
MAVANIGVQSISSDSVERGDVSRKTRSLWQACRCAQVAQDYKGQDTLVLDLTKVTPIFDYFVVTTGNSPRQMHAIADEVERVLREEGSRRLGVEGYENSSWILEDYGDIVLHIFTAETRKVYDLEHLWADAPQVDWRAHLESADTESTSRRLA